LRDSNGTTVATADPKTGGLRWDSKYFDKLNVLLQSPDGQKAITEFLKLNQQNSIRFITYPAANKGTEPQPPYAIILQGDTKKPESMEARIVQGYRGTQAYMWDIQAQHVAALYNNQALYWLDDTGTWKEYYTLTQAGEVYVRASPLYQAYLWEDEIDPPLQEPKVLEVLNAMRQASGGKHAHARNVWVLPSDKVNVSDTNWKQWGDKITNEPYLLLAFEYIKEPDYRALIMEKTRQIVFQDQHGAYGGMAKGGVTYIARSSLIFSGYVGVAGTIIHEGIHNAQLATFGLFIPTEKEREIQPYWNSWIWGRSHGVNAASVQQHEDLFKTYTFYTSSR